MKNDDDGEEMTSPCPHCKSADIDLSWQAPFLGGPMKFFFFCWNCRARGPEASSPEEARAAWNRR